MIDNENNSFYESNNNFRLIMRESSNLKRPMDDEKGGF